MEGQDVLVVDEVGELSVGLASAIVLDSPVVVTPVDLDWLHILMRGVSYRNFYGVEAYGVVDFLRLKMESARTAEVMEKIPGLNAVNMDLYLCKVGWVPKKTDVNLGWDKLGGSSVEFNVTKGCVCVTCGIECFDLFQHFLAKRIPFR